MQLHVFQKRQITAVDHFFMLLIAVTNVITLHTRGLLFCSCILAEHTLDSQQLPRDGKEVTLIRDNNYILLQS